MPLLLQQDILRQWVAISRLADQLSRWKNLFTLYF